MIRKTFDRLVGPGGRADTALAIALAAITFVLLLPFLDASMTSIRASVAQMPDEGTILSNADRVSRGHPLYAEVFDFKGPVGYLPYVLAFKFAPPTARTGRLVMFAILALWAAATFAVARRTTGRRSLGIVVALLIPLHVWQAWTYAYQDFTAQLFLVVAVLAALHAFATTDPPGPTVGGREVGIATAGACAALALWTSLAQGLTGLLALGVSVGLVALIRGGARDAVRSAAAFAAGALLASAAVFSWLASMGAVRAGIAAMLVFPFKHYTGSANASTYGYDLAVYSDRWPYPGWVHVAAKAMMAGVRAAPLVALVVALVVAVRLLVLAARPSLRVASVGVWPGTLARAAFPASLAATAVPVVLEKTRSDLCHIGFIEGGCLLALLAVFAARPAGDVARRFAAVARGAGAISLFVLLVASGAFYVHTLRLKAPGFSDIDVVGRAAYESDVIVARTRAADRIVVTPYGGWPYLYSRRDNATSFAFLIDDPYSAAQWPVAARQIVERRPVLLLVSDGHFEKLRSLEPSIGSMYFGYADNYMLDDRGPGSPFALPGRWELTGPGIDAEGNDRLEVSFRAEGAGSARLLAYTAAYTCELQAVIHGDILSWFVLGRSYIGTISAEGNRIAGTVFEAGVPPKPFAGRRLSP